MYREQDELFKGLIDTTADKVLCHGDVGKEG